MAVSTPTITGSPELDQKKPLLRGDSRWAKVEVTNGFPVDSGAIISGVCDFYFKDGPDGAPIDEATERVDWQIAAVPSGSVLVFRPKNQDGCVSGVWLYIRVRGEPKVRESEFKCPDGQCLLRFPVTCNPLP